MQPWPLATTHWDPGIVGRPPVRLILHATRSESGAGAGPPGTIVEATGHRLVVGAGEGTVVLLRLQIPGKKVLSTGDFLRGNRINPGDRLGEPGEPPIP